MQQSIIANPLSRDDLRERALILRKEFGFDKELKFPILKFAEIVLPEVVPGFSFQVASTDEMGDCHGLTFPETKIMKIREDVYEGAYREVGRDRLTIAHEVGHLFLHKSNRVAHARMATGMRIVTYCDPEWQADAFAGELLVPCHLVKGLSVYQVATLCGVSDRAARYQLSKI